MSAVILVVEDNAITRKMVRVALETEGYAVLEAESGAAALQHLQSGTVDLALQDLILPDVDGRELVHQLRAHPSGAKIPILAFSGFLNPTDEARGAPLGFTDFIFKPVDVCTLLETVRVHLQAGSGSGPTTGDGAVTLPGAGRHVLVADDNPTSLKLLRLQLQQLGFQVSVAHDGSTALEQARRERPDAIIADVLMPHMDGFRFCSALRDDPDLRKTPVLLYSAAYTEQADQELARHVGANALLPRSTEPGELQEALLKEIHHSAPEASAASTVLAGTSEEYTSRLVRQLEAQVRLNASVTRRMAVLEAKLAVFAGLSEALQRTSDTETLLGELLPCCMEAAQLSRGALFLLNEAGCPELRAHLGYSPEASLQLAGCFGLPEWLGELLRAGEVAHLKQDCAENREAGRILSHMGASHALVVPIIADGSSLGGLILASADRELTDNWPLFARALGSQIGQSIALTQAISKRKVAETALHEGEQRFRALADPMPEIAWTADSSGVVDYANHRWLEYAGIPIQEAQQREWSGIIHEKDLAHFGEQWQVSFRSGQPIGIDLRFRRASDGAYRWHTVRAVPYRNNAGEILRWYGSITDIDDRVRALEELAAADGRKDHFLAMLAHELRNPLSALSSALQVMKLAAPGSAAFSGAQAVAARQVVQQTRMVDDLLDVSRLTRGKVELRSDAVDLVTLLRECVEDHRSGLERLGLELKFSLPDAPVPVTGDRARLAQVFTNLLHNSVKFSHTGGLLEIGLQVEAEETTTERPFQGADCAVIRIRDTGIGIEPSLLPHIFEPFRQADTTLDRTRGGLGMGLALVRGLVEMHGGSVQAHSDGPNRGTLITVRIPVSKQELAAPATPAPELRTRPKPASASVGQLLIIEDNVDAAESLQVLLQHMGHEVEVAHSGGDGLDAARRLQPRVVICDIGLPGMSGYEVAEALRRDDQTASACLVALSGYGSHDAKERARAAGFDLHLTKPVEPAELIQHLDRLLAQPVAERV